MLYVNVFVLFINRLVGILSVVLAFDELPVCLIFQVFHLYLAYSAY